MRYAALLSFVLICMVPICPAASVEVKVSHCFQGVRDDPEVARRRKIQRLLAALETFHFQPQRSVLGDLIRMSEGLSPPARRYLARLAEFEPRRDRLTADVVAGKGLDKAAVTRLVDDVRGVLSEQARRLGPIVFFTRHPLARPNAANCYIWQSVPERWGCSIRTYDPSCPEVPPKTIFSDPEGSIFDMNLSRDGQTLFFSYKQRDEECWQIYEIGAEGQDFKKISRDQRFYDVGAIELPDGDLLFVSTRRGGFTVCQPGPSSNLHVMRRDGSQVRCVSQNTLSDFSPHVLPDGRVLFTRWEYVDCDLTYRQSLWTQNPDGRRYQLFFGNTIRDVGVFWQARPVPGHDSLVVATFAPHHGWPHGAIGLIDKRLGMEAPRDWGFAWITQEFPQIEDRCFRWSYRDPFPISDYQFLVSYGGGSATTGRFGLYLLDLCDNRAPIYCDPQMGCYGPMLLGERQTPPAVAELAQNERSPDDSAWGTVLVADVYRGLPGIQRGRVRYIQVMEQMRKMADLTHRAYDQSPVMSYATYDHSRPHSPGYRDLCTDVETGAESAWYTQRFLAAYNRRCAACHDGFPHPNDHGKIWDGRYAWIDFSRPEHSPALTVHLAKPCGGRGLGTSEKGEGAPPV